PINDAWTFTDVTGNYKNATGSVADDIDPVGSIVTVSWIDGSSTTFNSHAHSATASWTSTGTDGQGSPLTVTYVGIAGTSYPSSITAPSNAGSYRASASFVGDNNHTGNSNSADFTIAPADAHASVTGYSVPYDGKSHAAVGSATDVNSQPLPA